MKTASLKEIKTELSRVHPIRIQELCLQTAKYKEKRNSSLSAL